MRGRHDAVLPALDPQDGRGDGGDVKAPRRRRRHGVSVPPAVVGLLQSRLARGLGLAAGQTGLPMSVLPKGRLNRYRASPLAASANPLISQPFVPRKASTAGAWTWPLRRRRFVAEPPSMSSSPNHPLARATNPSPWLQ